MNLEVLISCMNQKDFLLVDKGDLQSDVLLINQCDEEGYEEKTIASDFTARMISTKERGLSKSRNMAISNSTGDICLIADDDEYFYPGYRDRIIESFSNNPNYDIITFIVDSPKKKQNPYRCKINFITSLRIGSCQIAFKREKIINLGIKFNEKFGSGTENGPGEENIFLYDCLKKGLKILYVPLPIAKVSQTESQWFKGYDEKYFYNRGKILKVLMGSAFASIYIIEFAVVKYGKFRKETSFLKALKFMFMGLRGKPFSKF